VIGHECGDYEFVLAALAIATLLSWSNLPSAACSTSARSRGATTRPSTAGLRGHPSPEGRGDEARRHYLHVRDRRARSRLAQARGAAGDRDVVVLGGATVIQQCLRAGLLSELRLHLAHILLGAGTSLFAGVDPATLALERTRLIDAEGVSHLTFRIDKPK
jgi:riboflavin biosynthesis pyrimidine reductase